MRSFLLFRGSRPGLFYDLSTGDSRPPRLSGSRWRAGLPPPHSLPTSRESCGFPPLISREKHSGLPPVTPEKTSCPSRCCKLFDALCTSYPTDLSGLEFVPLSFPKAELIFGNTRSVSLNYRKQGFVCQGKRRHTNSFDFLFVLTGDEEE